MNGQATPQLPDDGGSASQQPEADQGKQQSKNKKPRVPRGKNEVGSTVGGSQPGQQITRCAVMVVLIQLAIGLYLGVGCLVRASIDLYEPPELTNQNSRNYDGMVFPGIKAVEQYRAQKETDAWLRLPLLDYKIVVLIYLVLGWGLVGGAMQVLMKHVVDEEGVTLRYIALKPFFGSLIALLVFFLTLIALPAAISTERNPVRPMSAAVVAWLAGMFYRESYGWVYKKFQDWQKSSGSQGRKR